MDLKITVLRREFRQHQHQEPALSRRLLVLIEVAKGRPGSAVVLDAGVSERTVRRWVAAYRKCGVGGLRRSHGGGARRRPIRGVTAQRIREMRSRYRWGAELIARHLEAWHGTRVSKHRVERLLKRAGLVGKARRCKPGKHRRQVVVERPGAHTQVDVKYLDGVLREGQRAYVYSFVDHASKWRYRRAYDSFGPMETVDFLRSVLANVPFAIERLQTDNGIEFTNRFLTNPDAPREHGLDRICRENGIRHVLIPPGAKELQGLVERSHRLDDEELYHRLSVPTFQALNHELEKQNVWSNERRRRKQLRWLTAAEWLERHAAESEAAAADDKASVPLPEAA